MSLDKRLRDKSFTRSVALDALRGVAVPDALGREVMRACVVRGIRHHKSFVNTPGVQDLRSVPLFARAINARTIMSNAIPEAMTAEETPYCIWYPETASQATYRELAKQYPSLAYNAARACAVAGYTYLFRELVVKYKLVPEVAIAEDARACGSREIFESIMKKPIKFAVMNDYTRSIQSPPQPSCLNGDVAVRPMLAVTQKFKVPTGWEMHPFSSGDIDDVDCVDDESSYHRLPERGFEETPFNITEDWSIDEVVTSGASQDEWTLAMAEFLAQPLPKDLPLGNKDILIRAAAHTGNIDRYTRLRRPFMVNGELACLVRGIYHDHFFATWWAERGDPRTCISPLVQRAVYARMIMSNDLSRLTSKVSKSDQPYLIWYPDVAQESTYKELARRLPSMKTSVAHAAIYCDYKDLFDSLLPDIEPDPALLRAATHRGALGQTDHYTKSLMARAAQLGLEETIQDASHKRWSHLPSWTLNTVQPGVYNNDLYLQSLLLRRVPTLQCNGQRLEMFNGNASVPFDAYLWASVPRDWLPEPGGPLPKLDYEDWPPR